MGKAATLELVEFDPDSEPDGESGEPQPLIKRIALKSSVQTVITFFDIFLIEISPPDYYVNLSVFLIIDILTYFIII